MTTESDIQTTAPVISPVRLAVDELTPRISQAMNSVERWPAPGRSRAL
jgi:hypothetical protein